MLNTFAEANLRTNVYNAVWPHVKALLGGKSAFTDPELQMVCAFHIQNSKWLIFIGQCIFMKNSDLKAKHLVVLATYIKYIIIKNFELDMKSNLTALLVKWSK